MSSFQYIAAGLLGGALLALSATDATAQSAQSTRTYSIATQYNDGGTQSPSKQQHYIVLPATSAPVPAVDTASRLIVGRVVVADRYTPVFGARVSVDGLSVVTRSNDDGKYTLRQLTPGQHVVAIRAIGYKPQHVTVDVPASGMVSVNMQLEPIDDVCER